jgi:hypothetical protein
MEEYGENTLDVLNALKALKVLNPKCFRTIQRKSTKIVLILFVI